MFESGSPNLAVGTASTRRFSSIKDAVNECQAAHKDRDARTAALVAIVRASNDLLLELFEEELESVCRRFFSESDRRARSSIARQEAETQTQQSSARLVAATATFLDWTLIDGTRMAVADQKKLRISAVHYKKQASTMKGHGDWLALIANNLPPNKKVGQHFKNAELKHMWDKTHA